MYKKAIRKSQKLSLFIGLDKSGYQVHNFLISQHKHMLRNKKNVNTFWLEKVPYQELCSCKSYQLYPVVLSVFFTFLCM